MKQGFPKDDFLSKLRCVMINDRLPLNVQTFEGFITSPFMVKVRCERISSESLKKLRHRRILRATIVFLCAGHARCCMIVSYIPLNLAPPDSLDSISFQFSKPFFSLGRISFLIFSLNFVSASELRSFLYKALYPAIIFANST